MKVIDMKSPTEVVEASSYKNSRPESRLFPKTRRSFGIDKNHQGKVTINDKIRTSSALEQRIYLKSVFQDALDGDNNHYTAGNSVRTTTIFDPKAKVNASYNSNASHNPMEHNYARVLDIQLNARLKSRETRKRENSLEMELDSINKLAGGSTLYEVMGKFP